MRFHTQSVQPLTALGRFADLRGEVVGLLEAWGYQVHWRQQNTKDHGLPQSRPRFYMVALLEPNQTRKFTWPPSIACLPVERLLDARDAAPASLMPTTNHATTTLLTAMERLRQANVDPHTTSCFIDVMASAGWTSTMQDICPCLTATRSATGGHYITKCQRLLTVAEICRLQCLPPDRHDWVAAKVSQREFLRAVGNAMSANVLARILSHTLYAAGLTESSEAPGVDRFDEVLKLRK